MRSRTSIDSVNDNGYLVSEFDVSNCSGDNYNDIFENEEGTITEDSIVWVKNHKLFWEVRFNKTPFSDFPEDSND